MPWFCSLEVEVILSLVVPHYVVEYCLRSSMIMMLDLCDDVVMVRGGGGRGSRSSAANPTQKKYRRNTEGTQK